MRHAETAWSRTGHHTGKSDRPLKEHGEAEGARSDEGWRLAARCAACATVLAMNSRFLTPRVRAALKQLAAGPQDMRDEALLQQINDEMKKLSVEEIAHVRDRVRFSCPPCPMVQSVVLMLDGLIEVKNLKL
jgi:broad specificity phosphatase PhoE